MGPGRLGQVFAVAIPRGCTGDLNSDGAVNSRDLSSFLSQFGKVSLDDRADLAPDGVINTNDLQKLLNRLGGGVWSDSLVLYRARAMQTLGARAPLGTQASFGRTSPIEDTSHCKVRFSVTKPPKAPSQQEIPPFRDRLRR